MAYLWVFLLSMIGPFFWPINNGLVFSAAVASKRVDPYLAAVTIAFASTFSFTIWYAIGRFSRSLSKKWTERLDDKHLDRYMESTIVITILSAATSIPPLTPIALLAGSVRVPWTEFFLCTLLGRLARFLVGGLLLGFMLDHFEHYRYFELIQRWLS